MTKTQRRRAARTLTQAKASAAAVSAHASRAEAEATMSAREWESVCSTLEFLLRIQVTSPFIDTDHLCPEEAWLEVDLTSVFARSDRSKSTNRQLVEVVDALGRICIQAEVLRPWIDLFTAFWMRVLHSAERDSLEDDASLRQITRFMFLRGIHIALCWHDRPLVKGAVDAVRRFLDTSTGGFQCTPVQVALQLENCQLTSKELHCLRPVLEMRGTEAPLCDCESLRELRILNDYLDEEDLRELQALFEDAKVRRIDALCFDDVGFKSTTALGDLVDSALHCKEGQAISIDPGLALALNRYSFNASDIAVLHTALINATRPIRRLSMAWLRIPFIEDFRQWTRLLVIPLPSATTDFTLDISCIQPPKSKNQQREALHQSLAEAVAESTPRIVESLSQGLPVWCQLLLRDDLIGFGAIGIQVFKDPLQRQCLNLEVSPTAFHTVVNITDDGLFLIQLPDSNGRLVSGWVNSESIASIRIGTSIAVGPSCTRLIADGNALSERLRYTMLRVMGVYLTCLSVRNSSFLFSYLSRLLSCCPSVCQVNALRSGGYCEALPPLVWSTTGSQSLPLLQALDLRGCYLVEDSIPSLPTMPCLRYLQLKQNNIGAKGVLDLSTRFVSNANLSFVNVSEQGLSFRDPTEVQSKARSIIDDLVHQHNLSGGTKIGFLSVIGHQNLCSIDHGVIAAIFEFAGIQAKRKREVVW